MASAKSGVHQDDDTHKAKEGHEKDDHYGYLGKLDVRLTKYLAVCNDRYVPCRGRQIIRSISRSIHPSVWLSWLTVFMLISHDAALHGHLFNLLVGSVIAIAANNLVMAIVRRHRPLIPGGHQGTGLAAYSFPSSQSALVFMASCFVTRVNSYDPVVILLMSFLTVVICLAIVMLGRQYVFDMLGGWFIGFCTYQVLVRYLLIPTPVCDAYVKAIQQRLNI